MKKKHLYTKNAVQNFQICMIINLQLVWVQGIRVFYRVFSQTVATFLQLIY